jgi:ClpP class serine protease
VKFKREGALAITPKALGFDWLFDEKPQAGIKRVGSLAVIEIRGPMVHHDEWRWESYDAIIQRAAEAFGSDATAVLISGDTPGGEVSGLFDTARELRRLADASGKPFSWYVDGQTCSAGMGLAVAADTIIVPEEGRIGSIGVIAEIWNQQAAAEAHGAKCVLVTSGARKADGHPMNPITEDTISAIQASVNEEAAIFYAWVSERLGIPSEEIQGWEAGIFHGAKAVAIGLASSIGTFTDALSMLEDDITSGTPAGEQQETSGMVRIKKHSAASAIVAGAGGGVTPAGSRAESDDMKKLRGDLGKKAGEDSEEGRRARRALDAMDDDENDGDEKENEGDEGEDDEGSDDSASSSEGEDDAAAKAETEDESKKAEDESKKAKKAQDDAKKSEDDAVDEARKAEDEDAKARSAATFAEAKQHMAQAAKCRARIKALRASAENLRRQAQVHQSCASVHASLAKSRASAQAPKIATKKQTAGDRRAATLAGHSANPVRGQRQGGTPTSSLSIADADPADLRAAGLLRGKKTQSVRSDSEGLTVKQGMTPQEATELLAQLDAELEQVAQ